LQIRHTLVIVLVCTREGNPFWVGVVVKTIPYLLQHLDVIIMIGVLFADTHSSVGTAGGGEELATHSVQQERDKLCM
jgi:hypothetical protein